MSSLSVFHRSTPDTPNKVLTHVEDIAATLAEHGVRFEQVAGTPSVRPGSDVEAVMEACQGVVDRLMTSNGLRHVEVLSVDGSEGSVLDLHERDAEELRLFVSGRGLVSLCIEDYVYALLCEKGDLIAVPAGVQQWFDLGEQPRVVAVRMFGDQVEPRFAGESIASQFPRFDD